MGLVWAGKVASQKLGAKGGLSPVCPRPNPILSILTRSQILKLLVILKQEDKMKEVKKSAAVRQRESRAKKLAGLTEGEKESARKAESQRRAARRLRVKIEG